MRQHAVAARGNAAIRFFVTSHVWLWHLADQDRAGSGVRFGELSRYWVLSGPSYSRGTKSGRTRRNPDVTPLPASTCRHAWRRSANQLIGAMGFLIGGQRFAGLGVVVLAAVVRFIIVDVNRHRLHIVASKLPERALRRLIG